jgi:malate dehydrogenase (oxaloacetate-decarboxylating)(NADP+)
MDEEVERVAGMYLMLTKQGPIFLADTTVNIDPTVDELVDITAVVAKSVQKFNITPRIAMLSYSNFGSSETANPIKVRQAVEKLHKRYPHLVIDGEMQANFALNSTLLKDNYPFSTLNGEPANTLIFPNLDSGNSAYKILQEIGGAEAVGPILIGMKKPVHILQLGSSVREIVNMITIAVVDAQSKEEELNDVKNGSPRRTLKEKISSLRK